jgi:hypothetical protein
LSRIARLPGRQGSLVTLAPPHLHAGLIRQDPKHHLGLRVTHNQRRQRGSASAFWSGQQSRPGCAAPQPRIHARPCWPLAPPRPARTPATEAGASMRIQTLSGACRSRSGGSAAAPPAAAANAEAAARGEPSPGGRDGPAGAPGRPAPPLPPPSSLSLLLELLEGSSGSWAPEPRRRPRPAARPPRLPPRLRPAPPRRGRAWPFASS